MRYAIYFTPVSDDPLTLAAQRWLGRDAFTGRTVEPAPPPGVPDAERLAWTADPRRYGFHATLVAPFHLREGLDANAVASAADSFARRAAEFDVPLAISRIGGFFALTPAGPCPALDVLASDAVDHFAALRAPLTPAEIARRRPERLSQQQRAYLDRYGYPYVKEEFRFHMTLTGSLDAEAAARAEPELATRFAALLDRPMRIGTVAVFVEPAPGADFLVRSLHPFGAAGAARVA